MCITRLYAVYDPMTPRLGGQELSSPSTQSREAQRKARPSTLDTFDPANYRRAMALEGGEGGTGFGTLTREAYLARRNEDRPPAIKAQPRSTQERYRNAS